MMKHKLLQLLDDRRKRGHKSLAILIDPDKTAQVNELLRMCGNYPPDLFLVGSSFRGDEGMRNCIDKLRKHSDVPVALFPGNMNQVVSDADALLLLSVISSRNAELLIGKHVEASIHVKQSGLEVIPTGYILVESGSLTTVQYISQSLPVPRTKPELAAATALAGEQLGMKIIYLEAGSGADNTVPGNMISAVKNIIEIPLFTGGGIKSPDQLHECYTAGSDVAVVGNALENNPSLLSDLVRTRDTFNQ